MRQKSRVFIHATSRGIISIAAFLCVSAFLMPLRLSAQTPTATSDVAALIKKLQEQVTLLQTQIAELKTQIETSKKETEEIKKELPFTPTPGSNGKPVVWGFTRTLQRGERGDEVRKLQEYLAQFPDIYPQGLVTGFFGALTEAAVKKFQLRFALGQEGTVGPKTLAKINELIADASGASDKTPPGFLAAPGIQQRATPPYPSSLVPSFSSQQSLNGTTTPSAATSSASFLPLLTATSTTPGATTTRSTAIAISTPSGTVPAIPALPAEPAQTVPSIGVTAPATPAVPTATAATTTPSTPLVEDITPPVISEVQALSIAETSATISWKTDESSDSQVEYGATASYGSTTAFNPALLIGHAVPLSGLTSGATYHYRVKSKDAAGNLAISPDQTFTTTPAQTNTSSLTISNVTSTGSVNNTATTHDVGWETNKPADSLVEYGPTTSYGSRNSSPALTPTRLMGIIGLAPDTLYHFRVTSKDAAGNIAVSSDYTFRTLAVPGGGACIIHGGGLFPTYDAADVGAKNSSGEWPNGAYVKLKKAGVFGIADLKNACTGGDFDAMFVTFCNQVYTQGTQWVASYDTSSGQVQSRECLQGCATRTCPASLVTPPQNLGAILKTLSDLLQRLNVLLR